MKHITPYIRFLVPKLRFAASSSVGTLVDYVLFLALYNYLGTAVILSHGISYSIGALTNFLLHKTFVFSLHRKIIHAFVLSISFSLVGLFLSSLMLWWLLSFMPFETWTILAKLIVSGVIFFFNYYSKQFSFEKHLSM